MTAHRFNRGAAAAAGQVLAAVAVVLSVALKIEERKTDEALD